MTLCFEPHQLNICRKHQKQTRSKTNCYWFFHSFLRLWLIWNVPIRLPKICNTIPGEVNIRICISASSLHKRHKNIEIGRAFLTATPCQRFVQKLHCFMEKQCICGFLRTRCPPSSLNNNNNGKVTILCNQQVQTDRTIPNNKPDIVIRDNEKGTYMLIDVAISGGRNVIKKEAQKILKYKDHAAHVECENKGDTSNNRSDWDYLKVTQKIREQSYQENMKSRNYGKQPYWALHTYFGEY